MQIGMIGLGKMGANMSRRLARAGIEVVAFDRSADVRAAAAMEPRIHAAESLEALVTALPVPRTLWMMLPAGAATESTLAALLPLLRRGDALIDGANAYYRDSQRHGGHCAANGVEFVDAGVSGGIWGLENGYALMVGGSDAAIARLTPLLQALAPAPHQGWVHCGPVGAGHYAKMIHNGIEYGMMQAYAEGFALLQAKSEFQLPVAAIAESWRHGSVVRSWLLDLTAGFMTDAQALDGVAPVVADSGEGRWTALEAIELGIPAPVMSLALMQRFSSQGHADYQSKLLARMRQAFGGHPVCASPPSSPSSGSSPAEATSANTTAPPRRS
jgi:6-phosphogluconate dehydrogenase